MPTYDYKCNECDAVFTEIHSIKVKSKGCPSCSSDQVQKTISPFAAKTDQSYIKAADKYDSQLSKDLKRYQKDDKFAANITGADDPNHAKKLQKVLSDQQKKNEEARKKIKRAE